MVKWSLRAIFLIAISLVLSHFSFEISEDIFSEIYMVVGIMFPIALSQIMAFSFRDIENEVFINRYRKQLNNIRTVFIVLFTISTFIFLIKSTKYCIQFHYIKWDIRNIFLAYYIFCLYYFIRNFISLANLKDEIEDEIRKI
jgi:hypothetical protein